MPSPSNRTDASAPEIMPVYQAIGFSEMAVPDPNPGIQGVRLTQARWGMCFDVTYNPKNPALQVVVSATLSRPPSPDDPGGEPVSVVANLTANMDDSGLNALITWLGALKGARTTAAIKADKSS